MVYNTGLTPSREVLYHTFLCYNVLYYIIWYVNSKTIGRFLAALYCYIAKQMI